MSNLNDTPTRGKLREADLTKPGIYRLHSGRTVYDTGRVKVGLLADQQRTQRVMRGMSRDEERLQAALVRYGTVDGNAMHPSAWIHVRNRFDMSTAANRELYDGAFDLSKALAPLRRPSVIPLLSAWWRGVWDSARLYAALALAQARGLLR